MAISHTLSQQIIDTIHDVCGYNINFINTQGIISASTNPKRIGTYHEIGHQVALTGKTLEVGLDDKFNGAREGINIPIFYHQQIIAVVGITAPPEEARRYAHLAERITALLLHEQELSQVNRSLDLQKRYLIRALTTGEVDNREYFEDSLKHFHLDHEKRYRIMTFLFSQDVNISRMESSLQSLCQRFNQEVYAYMYPKSFIVCIEDDVYAKQLSVMQTFIKQNPALKCGIGQARMLKDAAISYQGSLTALAAIKETRLLCFDDLTIEILLSSLEEAAKKAYKQKILSPLKEEDCAFLRVYYDQQMSLTKTAKALYLHKNTIQQRLNTIASKTHLNPRHFEDAVLFYLALRI